MSNKHNQLNKTWTAGLRRRKMIINENNLYTANTDKGCDLL